MSEASEGDAFAKLFEHWRRDGARAFEARREAINSEFSEPTRFCSGYHFKALSDAAEDATTGMLARARVLPIGPDAFDLVKGHTVALFDALALEILPSVVDPQGRYRNCHENGVAARQIAEARDRAMAVIEAWELEIRLTSNKIPRAGQIPDSNAVVQLKPVPPAKLSQWFQALGPQAEAMTQEALLGAARTVFPTNAVARDRIRELTQGRKRGKKPIRD